MMELTEKAGLKENLEFTDAERIRRWREIRWRMEIAGLDVLLIWGNESKWQAALANNRYVSGLVAPGCIMFPLNGDPVIWSGFPHDVTSYGALANGWIKDIRAGQQTTRDIIRTLNDNGYNKSNIGIVGFGENAPRVIPETVPYNQFNEIKNSLPEAHFTSAGWLMEQVRMIKSSEEITMLERSGELTKLMAEAMIDSCKPGVTEYEVSAAMLHASLKNGGEEDMIWLSSGPTPPPHGKRPPATSRVLKEGDIIVTEYHACYKGYLTGAELSISIGEPRKEYEDIYKVCVESQKTGIAAMRPGNDFSAAVNGFRDPINKAGYGTVECGLHGHGLASPEFPSCMYGGEAGSWSEHAYAKIPSLNFKENMVFGTATDVYNPSFNRNTGLMLGRSILITSDGPKDLTGLPLDNNFIIV